MEVVEWAFTPEPHDEARREGTQKLKTSWLEYHRGFRDGQARKPLHQTPHTQRRA